MVLVNLHPDQFLTNEHLEGSSPITSTSPLVVPENCLIQDSNQTVVNPGSIVKSVGEPDITSLDQVSLEVDQSTTSHPECTRQTVQAEVSGKQLIIIDLVYYV